MRKLWNTVKEVSINLVLGLGCIIAFVNLFSHDMTNVLLSAAMLFLYAIFLYKEFTNVEVETHE